MNVIPIILLMSGTIFSYGYTSYAVKIKNNVKWLEDNKDSFRHADFFDEQDNFNQTLSAINTFIAKTFEYSIYQSLLQVSTILYILVDQYEPVILVALIVGYSIWFNSLMKIRRQRFITEGFCKAVLSLQKAIDIYEEQLKQDNKGENNERSRETN